MSQPSSKELHLLSQVADELREVFAERGYRVDVAMNVDPAFGSGWSRSAVTRDLVVAAVSSAASRVGVDFRPVNGSGREFRCLSGAIDRRYRLRRATRRADGSLVIGASADSALASAADSLFPEEQWTFAWVLSPDGQIDEVLAAEVVGYVAGHPGHLRLGPSFSLGGGGDMPTRGFRPTDESLEEFDEEEGFGDEFGDAS
jgi:hypothetical protein